MSDAPERIYISQREAEEWNYGVWSKTNDENLRLQVEYVRADLATVPEDDATRRRVAYELSKIQIELTPPTMTYLPQDSDRLMEYVERIMTAIKAQETTHE